jgi:hypothetical protein
MRFSPRSSARLSVVRIGIAALVLAATLGLSSFFTPTVLACDTYVSGYTRSDGTYVSGHYRSCANSTTADNWSTRGNYNPYTGEPGYRSPWEPSYSSPGRCYYSWYC